MLQVEVEGQGTFTLHAAAGATDEFSDEEDGQMILFERGEDGSVASLVAGGQTRLERVEVAPGD